MRIPEDLRIVVHPLSLTERGAARAARRGEIIHMALALLSAPPPQGDLERSVLEAMALMGEDPKRWDLEEEFLRPLERLFLLPEMKRWFQGEGHPELEVMDGEGRLQRVDRVVIEGEKVEVIEYKVGHREAWHRAQVRGYVELLKGLFPSKVIKGWLVYVDEGKIVEA